MKEKTGMKQNNKDCFVIGVTGGIGSGKSTVSDILKDNKAFIIDADKIARKVLDIPKVIKKLSDVFGDEILDTNKKVIRKKLSSIVFNNKDKLKTLNNITHNVVKEEIYKLYKNNKDLYDVIVLDVPIPIKVGFLDISNEVWVVVSNLNKRVERIKLRDKMNEEEIKSRINSQMSDTEYLKIATRVIYNDSTLEDLKDQVLRFYSDIKRK
jgi:dephospho-CoA kinase